jgi:ABC-2 type transport system ATP-binding protein
MINIERFTKVYAKQSEAVQDLSMHVEKGEIYGLIGPNGAGKTTTLRFISTLLQPTRGMAEVCGFNVIKEAREVRRRIGYMPDSFGLYEGMVVRQFLDFFGACYEVPIAVRRKMIPEILSLVDLEEKIDRPVHSLSRGMKQRLCLGKTLIHDPPVLILDEPASGLDPRARIEIKELLKELRRMGKTIVISSHILSELADLCTSVGIIEQGKLLFSGPVDDLYQKVREHMRINITVEDEDGQAGMVLQHTHGVTDFRQLENGIWSVDMDGDRACKAELLGKLVGAGIHVSDFSEQTVSLEEVFMVMTKGRVN